ncbi:MAG: hypothetical protein AB3N11_03110 [Arenibacterium sp.]
MSKARDTSSLGVEAQGSRRRVILEFSDALLMIAVVGSQVILSTLVNTASESSDVSAVLPEYAVQAFGVAALGIVAAIFVRGMLRGSEESGRFEQLMAQHAALDAETKRLTDRQ